MNLLVLVIEIDVVILPKARRHKVDLVSKAERGFGMSELFIFDQFKA